MFGKRSLVLVAIVSLMAAAACLCTGGIPLDDLEDFSSNEFNDLYQTTSTASMDVGTSATGSISTITDAHNWTFQGSAGQTIVIEAVGQNGLDPKIALYDPSLDLIAENDDFDGLDSYIETSLPEDGTYTVRLSAFTTGDYILTVR